MKKNILFVGIALSLVMMAFMLVPELPCPPFFVPFECGCIPPF